MSGIILTPPAIMEPYRVSDNRRLLYKAIANKFGWDILTTDSVPVGDVLEGFDWIMIDPRKYLRRKHIEATAKLLTLPLKTKVIFYALDIELPSKHNKAYDIEAYAELQVKLLYRANIILGDMHEYFVKRFANAWSDLRRKYVWFPKAVMAMWRYQNQPGKNWELRRCLVAGKAKAEYALRNYLIKHGSGNITHLKHPGYGKLSMGEHIIGGRFADMVNRHACAFCGSKNTNYVLEKYMLIPAANTLLLGRRVADLDRAGFVPGTHYVEVTQDNVLSAIKDAIQKPEDYCSIVRASRKHVFEAHTVDTRLRTLAKELGRRS